MNPHPIDTTVGSRIRRLRESRGHSQSDLAKHLGLTFQQVQKYERGTNRVSASKLWEIADFLEVQVTDFFGDTPMDHTDVPIFAQRAGANELMKAWSDISDPDQRAAVLTLVRSLRTTA